MTPIEVDFHFDGKTRYIDGNPVIIFGESYHGEILLRNPNNNQYIISSIAPDDPDMKILPYEEKDIMPGETRMVSFEISTPKNRNRPFKLGVQVNGGFIV